MQKLIALNGYVTPCESPELSERIGKFSMPTVKTYEHDSLGIIALHDSEVHTINRSADYFAKFDSLAQLVNAEKEIRQQRNARAIAKMSPNGLIGGVHTVPYTIYNLYRSRQRDVWNEMRPHTNERFVGIELEVCSPFRESSFVNKLRKSPFKNYVSLCGDGSIEPASRDDDCDCDYDDEYGHSDYCAIHNTDYGIEMRILCKESELHHVMGLASNFISDAECYVNNTCGLHVHLDMRTRDVDTSYERLFNNLPIMKDMVHDNRLRNTYCKINSRSTFDDHAELDDRYHAINTCSYDEHSTLEVRLHHGSIDVIEIENWINFLVDTVEGRNVIQAPQQQATA